MQQTTKYKLDLIEKTDAFSPDALNQNAQKLETKLAALDAADSALNEAAANHEGRITALELRKIVVGSYVGTGKDTFVDLGFTPAAVLVFNRFSHSGYCVSGLVLNGSDTYFSDAQYTMLTIVENGFKALAEVNSSYTFHAPTKYHYIAFG